jgi:hypothetical protein
LPISHTIAAWLLQGDDLNWLNKEYQKMFEFFKDSPALQWMEESVRQEEQRKADQRVLAERKQANKKMLEERKQADKKMLTTLRQTVVALVSQRFPTLQRLAKTQVRTLEQPGLFQELILRLSVARDIDEAQDVLFSLNEKEEEDEQ